MLNKNQTLQEGRFCILEQVDKNAPEISYKAFDKNQNIDVLIKEIHSGNAQTTENSKQNFSNKAEVIINLNHQSLLKVENYFAEEDRHYLVMEKLKGQSLGELLKHQKHPFSLAEVTNWAYQMLDAVNYLHNQENQILHRDIKPDNTLLDDDGNIKLYIHSVVQNFDSKTETVSEDEQFDSTNLAYTPLEQVWEYLDLASQNVIVNSFDDESQEILKRPVDIRGDLYSIGATLYFLATAKMPFDALSRLIDMMDGNDDPLKTPNQLNPEIPKEVSDVIMGALEIRRENRYSTATIMKQILRAAVSKSSKKEYRSPKITKSADNLKNLKPIDEFPSVNPVHNFDDKFADELEIPALEIEQNSTIKPHESKPKKLKPFEAELSKPNSKNSIDTKQSNKIQTDEPPKDEIKAEQEKQLELIKIQLKVAEEKRIAAEKLVERAERLLNSQELMQTKKSGSPSNDENPKPFVQEDFVELDVDFDEPANPTFLKLDTRPSDKINKKSLNNINDPVTDKAIAPDPIDKAVSTEFESDAQDLDTAKEPPPFLDVNKKIIPEYNEEFRDNFVLPTDDYENDRNETAENNTIKAKDLEKDDLIDQSEQEPSKVMKFATGAVLLLLIVGGIWIFWKYVDSLDKKAEQVIRSTNFESPIETEKIAPPIDEPPISDLKNTESKIEPVVDDSTETIESNERINIEPKVAVQPETVPPPALPAKRRISKPKPKTQRIAKPKRTKPLNTQAPKPVKKAEPKKKTVTLDDLLNDN